MPAPTPQQSNAMARMLIQQNSVEMRQQIFAQTINQSAAGTVVNVIPRNVGLIKGFWVRVQATANNTDGALAATPTDFAASNLLSQISFTDLNNNVRIQTTGWHLALVNSLKAKRPYGVALKSTADDGPVNYGANWSVQSQPASIAHGASGALEFWYYVPLAYSDSDYRGAVYANVVNATMQLSLTINPTPAVAAGADSTAAVFTGTASVNLNPVTITVFQLYMDQIPFGQGGPILPLLDLATIYELKNTAFTAMVPNQDFPMQYANFRDFLSTVLVYFNGTARGVGADVNYFTLQSANFTNIWKNGPTLQALRTRNHLGFDLVPGAYYFGSREKPIATVQYGNMELVLNPITAGAGAYALVGYEDFALVNTITGAGSLPAS